MKMFIPAVVGLAFGFTVAVAFAADGTTNLRRTTRLDLLADRSEAATVDGLVSPGVTSRVVLSGRLGGVDPILVVAPLEPDTAEPAIVLGGMVVEAHRVPDWIKQAPEFRHEKLDRIALDPAELEGLLDAKTPASVPTVDGQSMESKD